MKANNSLSFTNKINQQLQRDLSGVFYDMIPFKELAAIKSKHQRDRIYNTENTLLTMLLTMTKEDKSLQNSVNIFSRLHAKNKTRIEMLQEKIKKDSISNNKTKKVGRPRTTAGRIAMSKTKDISTDTSGYSQARQRLPSQALDIAYKGSKDFTGINCPNKWYGMRVFITDGTYLQMQDTDAIKKEYRAKKEGGYPRGLLEAVIEQGSGVVYDYELGPDSKSELELFSTMISNMPRGSILLADDLYNCFAIFSLLKQQGVEIIVPGKRKRKYKTVQTISPGDEIIEIKKSSEAKWLNGKPIDDNTLLMRRIEYSCPQKENEKLVLYTSLLDNTISKTDIIMKYESRWDIEISIREIKMIMDVNVVRAKSPGMARKEVAAALIAYNYIRKIIAKTAEDSDFPPEKDIIQEYYEINKPVLLDRLGRKYSKRPPGRPGHTKQRNIETQDSYQAWATL